MAEAQLNLPIPDVEPPGSMRGATLEDQFWCFHFHNPQVMPAIIRIALELKDEHGFKTCGIALIFERMRWLYALRTGGGAYKLNNNYRAFYARLIMEREPRLRGFFRVRAQPSQEPDDE